ncbi:MAG: trypsin-like peptidase domain-containing protein, partial [Verrucomicrobiaceae bacterium]|nr:trypsin-like peptidase domain-containing protein [Verrucomicrobiaceae bacterium]
MQIDPLSNQYVRFARAVFEATDDSNFPTRRLGSGTIIAWNGSFLLLTARHVVTNLDADPTAIVVSYPDSRTSYWPTLAYVHLEVAPPFANDNTFGDLALYKMNVSQDINSIMLEHDYLPFPEEVTFSKGAPLFAFGFPDVEYDIDLDNKQHILTEVAVEECYAGATAYRGVHVFESTHLQASQNGMSGGPVTYLDA